MYVKGNFKNINYTFLVIILMCYFYIGKTKLIGILGVNTDYFFWILLILCALSNIVLYTKYKITVSRENIFLYIYIIYLFFSTSISSYKTNAYIYLVFFIIASMVYILLKKARGISRKIFKGFMVGSLFFCVSVLLQWLLPSFINALRKIVLIEADYKLSQIGYENTTNYMAGLGPNVAGVAFFLSILIGILYADIILQKKKTKWNYILILFGFVSIILTQKRSLILANIISMTIITLFFNRNTMKKFKYLVGVVLTIAIVAPIAYHIFPAFTTLVERFLYNDNLFSGREIYYTVMQEWFNNNRIFGVGIGTANATWGYGGHNIYKQMLGETGIVGCIFFAFTFIPSIIKNFRFTYYYINHPVLISETNAEDIRNLIVCTYSTITIAIYGIAGNPLYDYIFCLTFFVMLAMPKSIMKELRENH